MTYRVQRWNHTGMQGHKCSSSELRCMEAEKQQHMNGPEGIFSLSAPRLTEGRLQNVRNSMQRHCQACHMTFSRDFEFLLQYNLLMKCFSVPFMRCCFCGFSLSLCTIARDYGGFPAPCRMNEIQKSHKDMLGDQESYRSTDVMRLSKEMEQ
ncbi:hypothetical protein TNCV_4341401 [Trichonephila clavipes]|nr:hypothetical protein TNCV_4341401 [Trichonephila clavipes]